MMKKYFYERSNIGKIMLFIGILVILPIIVVPFYQDEAKYIPGFLISGGSSILLGLLFIIFGGKATDRKINWRHNIAVSNLTVLFAWIWGVLIGALPFYIMGQLTFVQSLFEAVSGWTTTGLSTVDVRLTPQVFLFHRAFMQYCGGLGFIMMMVMFISNKQSMNLYAAEGHPDKIMPNIKKTAMAILLIYNVCLVIGTTAYVIAGMNLFDAVCHSMCSLSTGGFSNKLNSIGEYDSLPIEIITIALMLIGTTNFAALILLAKGKLKQFFNISEIKFMLCLLLVFIPLTALSLSNHLEVSFWEGLRKSSFDVVSALSTTGYSTMSYQDWPAFGIGILILCMLIGGGIGSTAGGLKMSRVYLMLRLLGQNIKSRITSPNRVEVSYYYKASGRTPIDKDVLDETVGFFLTYIVVFLVGSLSIVAISGCELWEGMFDFASSLGTVGLSSGITGPDTASGVLIVEMIGMMLGRLEIFIVLMSITFGFSSVKHFFSKKSFERRERLEEKKREEIRGKLPLDLSRNVPYVSEGTTLENNTSLDNTPPIEKQEVDS